MSSASSSGRRLRVLVLTTSFPLSSDSSSGIFVGRLASALSSLSDVRVLVPSGTAQGVRTFAGALDVRPVRYAPRSWQRLAHSPGGVPVQMRAEPRLRWLIPALGGSLAWSTFRSAPWADVIHANWAACGVIAGVIGKLTGTPVITTLRGADVNGASGGDAARGSLAMAMRLSDRMVTVSSAMAESVVTKFPRWATKVGHLPNGVDAPAVAPHRTPPLRRLLTVGSLITRKRVDVAIEALVRLPSDYTLTVVGEGPLRGSLEALATAVDVRHRVHFAGSVEPSRMQQVYAEHDLLVHPSQAEGMPNVVLEAFANAMPVIVSDIDGVGQVVRQAGAGCAYPVGDVDGFADGILGLTEADTARYPTCGSAGRQWLSQQGLTWSACAERYMSLFGSVAR